MQMSQHSSFTVAMFEKIIEIHILKARQRAFAPLTRTQTLGKLHTPPIT